MSDSEVGWAYAWRIITMVIGFCIIMAASEANSNFGTLGCIMVGVAIVYLEVTSLVQYAKTTDNEREELTVDGTHLGLAPWYIIGSILIGFVFYVLWQKIKPNENSAK
jgi:hypothetical protein